MHLLLYQCMQQPKEIFLKLKKYQCRIKWYIDIQSRLKIIQKYSDKHGYNMEMSIRQESERNQLQFKKFYILLIGQLVFKLMNQDCLKKVKQIQIIRCCQFYEC
ncbi:hypothetical protein FGO68_gene15509 [Halteria grandinella]|uniref:Uncharacterized protein n=1 Tax=Halteria grandinella TaxID=5974 RepID=A0A8J8SYG3_HALGN|nr:hypothetical protein FGO68_gene15509 [Halteria grandinella]